MTIVHRPHCLTFRRCGRGRGHQHEPFPRERAGRQEEVEAEEEAARGFRQRLVASAETVGIGRAPAPGDVLQGLERRGEAGLLQLGAAGRRVGEERLGDGVGGENPVVAQAVAQLDLGVGRGLDGRAADC